MQKPLDAARGTQRRAPRPLIHAICMLAALALHSARDTAWLRGVLGI